MYQKQLILKNLKLKIMLKKIVAKTKKFNSSENTEIQKQYEIY